MSATKWELQALEYRARAEDASSAARTCALERTREQHELAALRWIELAQAAESRALSNRTRLGPSPSRAAGALNEGTE